MKTRQQIFDTVAVHLLTQMRRSMLGLQCRYRGSDGLKCAVGVLIPDEYYDPEMEGAGVHDRNVGEALVDAGIVPEEVKIATSENIQVRRERFKRLNLLDSLQVVHDLFEPAEWRARLTGLAKKYGLSTAAMETIAA